MLFQTRFLKDVCMISLLCFLGTLYSADKNNEDAGNKLLNQYIQAKGSSTIVFDATNIKQFWTDKSVSCSNGLINIILRRNKDAFESKRLNIQLINVSETQDCSIELVSESKDVSFTIENTQQKVLAHSVSKDDFYTYHISTAKAHLEDMDTFSFNIICSSAADTISIKSIILSFSKNEKTSFLGSSGYDTLLKQIQEKGIQVQNSEVRYLIDTTYNKLFVMIPDEIASAYRFYYHTYPVDEKNLDPDRVQYGFNNVGFTIKKEKLMIPKPYSSKSLYTIIQLSLPTYEYAQINVGQNDGRNKIWMINLSSDSSK